MDNASYHSAKIKEQTPQYSWKKAKLIEFLKANDIPIPAKPLKEQLWTLAREIAVENPRYKVDQLIESFGMVVLRLPPYHCELNPIEKI